MDDPYVEIADKCDPEVAKKIILQEKIAATILEMLNGCFRNQPGQEMLEDVTNTLGITCAELVRFGIRFDKKHGSDVAETLSRIIKLHIENAMGSGTKG